MSTETLRYDQAPGRREMILSRLRATGFLSIAGLAHELGVSDMTIRRDLRRLAADGEVLIVHGGVSLPHPTLRTSEFVARARANAEDKRTIAHRAVELIQANDTIAIDAGTTAYDVVHELPDDFAGSIVTHSVPVYQAMLGRPQPHVVGLGGDLLRTSQAFVGPATVALEVRSHRTSAALRAGPPDPGHHRSRATSAHSASSRRRRRGRDDLSSACNVSAGISCGVDTVAAASTTNSMRDADATNRNVRHLSSAASTTPGAWVVLFGSLAR